MTATDLDETSTVASSKSSELDSPAVEKKKKKMNETIANLKAKASALLPASNTKDRRDDTCEKVVRSSATTSSRSLSTTTTTSTSMFVIRHGDRWDYAHPKWKTSPNTKRPGDPPLSDLGLQQARETGIYLSQVLREEQFTHLHVLVSPFLRTIETANEIVSQMERRLLSSEDDETSYIPMKLECCVWEIESDDPAIAHINEERYRYFPRTDMTYKTMFVPKLPESKEDSLIRCERAMEAIEEQFVVTEDGNHRDAVKLPTWSTNKHCNKPQQVKQAVIVVTHAAVCIGLAKAATKCTLQDINPAGPCSIYRFDYCGNRSNKDGDDKRIQKWTMDHYAMEGGHNGHMKHISEWGKTTIPWNSFGHRTSSGHSTYTGPPRKEIEHLFQVPPARWY